MRICRGYGLGASAGPVYRPDPCSCGGGPGAGGAPALAHGHPAHRPHRDLPRPGSDASTTIKVKLSDGAVVSLSMADYLWRVVAAEMPASFEPEALKAQAVTARTYTLYKRSIGVNPNHPDADVCADINCCQAYLDRTRPPPTGGTAPRPIRRRSPRPSLPRTDRPSSTTARPSTRCSSLLRGGADPELSGGVGRQRALSGERGEPGGEEVPKYRTTVEVPAEEFRTTFLAQYPQADLSGEASGGLGRRYPPSSGGVETMSVGGVTVKGTALRTLFGLRSASFTVEAEGDQVVFSVTGYGHGVGMSQYGANALAKEGRATWTSSPTTIPASRWRPGAGADLCAASYACGKKL